MGRRVDVSVLQVACATWRMMSELQVRLEDLVEVLQRGVELADDGLEENVRDAETELAPKQIEVNRDERGRKVITRDHGWRDKTLDAVRAAGSSGALIDALAAQLDVSPGALQMRLGRLRDAGLVERINRSWRAVEVQP